MLSVLVLTWLYATAVAAVVFVGLVLVQSVARARQHVAHRLHERRRRSGARAPLTGTAGTGSRA